MTQDSRTIQALKDCIKLWQWLAENKVRRKIYYFDETKAYVPRNCCPLCELYESPKNCKKCNALMHWSKLGGGLSKATYFCEQDASVYSKWQDPSNSLEQLTHYANLIVRKAQVTLRRVE